MGRGGDSMGGEERREQMGGGKGRGGKHRGGKGREENREVNKVVKER